MASYRMTITEVATELRKRGGHPPLCYWVNLRQKFSWRNSDGPPRDFWLPKDEAEAP